jgi:methyl-accepting chemotaxis protein
MFGNMKLSTKLVVSFLFVGVLPFLIIGGVAYREASNALEAQSYGQLEGLREIKKMQIEKFFAERRGDMGVIMETVATLRLEAIKKLVAVRDIKKNQIQYYFMKKL